MFSPTFSQNAGSPRMASNPQSKLQPSLPIISLPQSQTPAPANMAGDFEESHVRSHSVPSGMVHGLAKSTSSEQSFDGRMSMTDGDRSESPKQMQPFYHGSEQLDGLGVTVTPPKPSGDGLLGIQYPGQPPIEHPSYGAPAQPLGGYYHSSTTHTTSTFVPSSAYLPSKSQFAGVSPQMASMPRSAPSTPLGRQDARFLSQLRGQSSPQPLQTGFAPPAGSAIYRGSPNLGAPGSAQFSHSPSMQSWYSQDEYYDVSPGGSNYAGSMYASSGPGGRFSPASPHVPYVRDTASPGISSLSKRLSPFVLQSPPSAKKPKKSGERMLMPKSVTSKRNTPLLASSTAASSPKSEADEAVRGPSPAESAVDEKPKIQRCRIACSECRKTRLKCKSGRPRTCYGPVLKRLQRRRRQEPVHVVHRQASQAACRPFRGTGRPAHPAGAALCVRGLCAAAWKGQEDDRKGAGRVDPPFGLPAQPLDEQHGERDGHCRSRCRPAADGHFQPVHVIGLLQLVSFLRLCARALCAVRPSPFVQFGGKQ